MTPDPEPESVEPEPLAEFDFASEGVWADMNGDAFGKDLAEAGLSEFTYSSIDGGEGGWQLVGPAELMPYAIGAVLEHDGRVVEEPPTEVEVLRAELEELREALRGKADVEG